VPISTRHFSLQTTRAEVGRSGSNGLARFHTVAAAALLCAGMLQISDAQALALGRMIVQSPLGEPLRAEVEVLELTNEESADLNVGLGSMDAFRAAGMDFNAALIGVRVSLERRPDGRSFLRLTGNRPVSEPFVDMVVEARWKSGRVARDYTLLFDPPKLRQPAPAAPLSAAVDQQPATAPAPAPAANSAAPAASPTASNPSAPTAAPAPARNDRVVVARGDTAGQIAQENLPANVSLDQMLVAMLRANPRAFIQGNVNRVKAGAVLTCPR
jgi:pilus assembly protein FimV